MMMKKRKSRVGFLWVLLFVIWGLFLSGGLSNWVGSPGLIQALELKKHKEKKLLEYESLKKEIAELRIHIQLLESDKKTQLREIRRVLSYIGPDELIFDFK
jgi:cell division protein FtsB